MRGCMKNLPKSWHTFEKDRFFLRKIKEKKLFFEILGGAANTVLINSCKHGYFFIIILLSLLLQILKNCMNLKLEQ